MEALLLKIKYQQIQSQGSGDTGLYSVITCSDEKMKLILLF